MGGRLSYLYQRWMAVNEIMAWLWRSVCALPHGPNFLPAVVSRFQLLPYGGHHAPSQFTAESLLCTYLHGRSTPMILRDAVVWVIAARPASNETPMIEVTTHASLRHPGHKEFGTSVY